MVDGDPTEANSLKEALIAAHIIHVEVQHVDDGEQALAYLRQEYPFLDAGRPHVIFLGMNLPGMRGQELIEQLHKDTELKPIPVAVLTTSTDSE